MSRSFLGREKKNVGKSWERAENLETRLKKKVKEWELTDELFSHLEEFICTLYGYEEKDVNKVRWLKFRDKHTKQNKVIEMAALPPCKKTLKLQSVWANYLAKMWRSSLQSNTDATNFSGCVWLGFRGYIIKWIHNPFQHDMDDKFF